MNRFRQFAATLIGSLLFHAPAFSAEPIAGLWGIDAETNLAVGRAFALEVTGSTLIVTFYNYNASKQPTFYVGGAALSAIGSATVALSEPKGGTCLGCTPTSGSLLSSPGSALFEFTTSTKGFVTLPGETRKAISKGMIAWPDAPSGLLGRWVFLELSSDYAFSDVYDLTRVGPPTANGNGIVANLTGTAVCELQVSGARAGSVVCATLYSDGTPDRSIVAQWWGHQMDGEARPTAYSSLSARRWTARRIITAAGASVGVKRGDDVGSIPADQVQRFRMAIDAATTAPSAQ